MASGNLIADRLAARLLVLLNELAAMVPGADVAGAKPNVSGAILKADHQGYRRQVATEIRDLQQQLLDLGYTVDESGNATSLSSAAVSYGVT